MKELIFKIVDEADFFEISAVIMGQEYHRADSPVWMARASAIVANQPQGPGRLFWTSIPASTKAARFVRFCDCLQHSDRHPGRRSGLHAGHGKQEYGGLIKHGAKLLFAYAEATVPKITLDHPQGLWRRV